MATDGAAKPKLSGKLMQLKARVARGAGAGAAAAVALSRC
jgi:hypothetical protein